MRRAFTLIELCYVLAIIGLLAAVTVPAYDTLLRRSRTAEAQATVHAIAHAELQHLRDRGTYVHCPAVGDVADLPAPFPDAPCWRALGVRVGGDVRYLYGVVATDEGFTVTAEGDQDGDGILARYTLDGATLHLEVEDELE